MDQKSMTALVSAFARGYHAAHNETKIFDDSLANKILSDEERQQIAAHMSQGISFFNPAFQGTKEEALRWIVDHQLSPTPLGRAAWAERALRIAAGNGAKQYLIIAAGYDTFAYRRPKWAAKLHVFELDHPVMSADKQKRAGRAIGPKPDNLSYVPIDLTTESLSQKMRQHPAFDPAKLSFCSLLGIAYYLTKGDFAKLLQSIADCIPKGSSMVFDYPDEQTHGTAAEGRAQKQAAMAKSASEAMLASYAYDELEQLLSDAGFLIYEHLTPEEMTEQYFAAYNRVNPDYAMTAFDHVNYCLAIKR